VGVTVTGVVTVVMAMFRMDGRPTESEPVEKSCQH
jgi:hypothetical protein